jgi:hypothetical protein
MNGCAHVVATASALALLGCAGGLRPGTIDPGTPDSISTAELRREMETVRGLPDFYPIALGLAGGAVGALAGWQVGCALGIGGGDDPGLDGCVLGGAGGAIAGIVVGATVGGNLTAEWRRDEAVRRIRARRRQAAALPN